MEKLETARLFMRPFKLEDAAHVFKLSQEETLRLRMPDQVYESVKEAEEAVSFLQKKTEAAELPYVLGIMLKETGELIGHVGLSPIPEGTEIGYAIGMEHQGRGYATEAVEAFSKWVLKHFLLNQLWAVVEKGNTASQKVLEKAGYALYWAGERLAFGGHCQCMVYLFGRKE